jgi:hypothetical protein
VTNDGATILSLLDIEHPAGKILVDLAQQQDKEVWVPGYCFLTSPFFLSVADPSLIRLAMARLPLFSLLQSFCGEETS